MKDTKQDSSGTFPKHAGSCPARIRTLGCLLRFGAAAKVSYVLM
jgi:hypothetical protein